MTTTDNQTDAGFDTSEQPPLMVAPDPAREVKDPASAEPKIKRKDATKKDDEEGAASPAPRAKESRDVRAISLSEDASLRDILEALGTDGAFKIKVSRVEPTEHPDPVTGKRVKVDGHLKDYVTKIDEADIAKNHGGGRFKLRIMNRRPDGSLGFFKERTIDIAGDPRTDDVPRTMPASSPSSGPTIVAAPQEDGKVATAALGMAERIMDRMASTPAAVADHRPYELMISALRESNAALERRMEALTKELAETRNAKPETDPFRDKLLDKMMDGDNARITALRAQHESEVRTIKESAREDEKRSQDRFERMLADVKSSYEREIASMRSMNEIMRQSLASTGDAQVKALEGQIRALDREVSAKDKELIELRAKKDKGLLEQLTEMNKIKEALNNDDGEEKGTVGQIMEALPEIMPTLGGFFGKGPAPAAAPAAPAQAAIVAQPRRVIKGPDGRKFVMQGNKIVKEIPAHPTAPGEAPIPHVAPETSAQILGLLERAFEGNQEPEIVAQSVRPMLAGREEIFQAVRAMGGVDQFLVKVANLPSSSPLATQAGKNWTRKLSKALVGD